MHRIPGGFYRLEGSVNPEKCMDKSKYFAVQVLIGLFVFIFSVLVLRMFLT